MVDSLRLENIPGILKCGLDHLYHRVIGGVTKRAVPLIYKISKPPDLMATDL